MIIETEVGVMPLLAVKWKGLMIKRSGHPLKCRNIKKRDAPKEPQN